MINVKTIQLKPFGIEDADFLLRWNNDPDAKRMALLL